MASKVKHRKDSFFNLYFTTTISIALVLLTIGFTAYLMLFTNKIGVETRENLAVSIVLKDGISESQQGRIEKYIKTVPFIKDVSYVSKEQALSEHIEAFGEDPLEILDYNPIQASYEIKLQSQYTHPDSVKWIADKVKAFEGVVDVVFEKDMLESISQNLKRITLILMVTAILLLIISVALISNTIKISVYSKRFIINTMKLVGAKPWFIRKPFVLRHLLNGILAAVVSLSMLCGILYWLQVEVGESMNLFQLDILLPVVLIVVVLATIITVLSSVFGVNRYLRMKTDDLYYI
ncbi:MAG: permease-like cell division protein FtsX [Bacteroidales bacterium]|nr:permease-like cell division protein FtsX [Bacteroidales bacterium]